MQRDDKIDIIKGLLICSVVLGHCGAPFTSFIYLFHMAAFFIASGLVYKSSYADSFGGLSLLFRKRVKSLWVPFIGFSAIFLFCWNLLVKFHFFDADYLTISQMLKKLFLRCFMIGGGSVPMCGALWFLFSLFSITMIYSIFDFSLKKINFPHKRLVHILIAIIFFLCNYFLINNGHKSSTLNHIMGPYIAYALGVEMSHWNLNSINEKIYLPMLLMTFFILLVCSDAGRIELTSGVFSSPYFFIVASISGWFLLYAGAFFCNKISLVKKIFTYLGRNTICIIGLHFFAFKLVTLLQIKLYDLPIQKLTAFPFLIKSSGWWLVYFFVSIAFCLLLNLVYKKTIVWVKMRFTCDRNDSNVLFDEIVNEKR